MWVLAPRVAQAMSPGRRSLWRGHFLNTWLVLAL